MKQTNDDFFSKINERFLQLIENKSLGNQKKFSEMIGFAPQVISNIVSGRKSKPSFDVLNAVLSSFIDINAEWLLTGQGSMLKSEQDQSKKTQRKSNYTDEELRAITRGELKVSKNTSQTQEVTAYESPKGVPLLPFDAFAGIGDNIEGISFDTIEERYVIPLFDGIKVDFMIPVRGSSMYPKYSSGDVVACRLIKDILFFQWNKVYVLDTISQGVIIKRVKKSETPDSLRCVSDNKDYDPFDIPMEDVRNIALVVGVIRLE